MCRGRIRDELQDGLFRRGLHSKTEGDPPFSPRRRNEPAPVWRQGRELLCRRAYPVRKQSVCGNYCGNSKALAGPRNMQIRMRAARCIILDRAENKWWPCSGLTPQTSVSSHFFAPLSSASPSAVTETGKRTNLDSSPAALFPSVAVDPGRSRDGVPEGISRRLRGVEGQPSPGRATHLLSTREAGPQF